MRTMLSTLAVAAAFTLMATAVRAQDTALTCEDARCIFQQEVTANCSCEEAGNHGQYVKCVGRIVRALTADNSEFKSCRGKIIRCAARSTCGKKEGFVTCNRNKTGICDTSSGFCADEGFTDVACLSDADCVVGTRCSIKRDAEKCEARGGVVGTSPTCCSDCVPG